MITLQHDNHTTTTLDLDISAYLADRLPAHFLEGYRGDMLIGACLFHTDGMRPNLAIFTESGGYFCNACGASGNVVSLVQRIEGFATYGVALAWLREVYGINRYDDGEERPLRLSIGVDLAVKAPAAKWSPPDPKILDEYRWRSSYLEEERGIEEAWQRRFDIGFDRRRKAITFPWYDRKGALMTVQYRPTWTKGFWFLPCGRGVKKALLYGIHHVQRRQERRVAVVEAPICAMSVWQSLHASHSLGAVATGGSVFTDEMARELALAGVEEVVALGDRDAAGARMNAEIERKMARYGVRTLEAEWPRGFDGKDANEALLAGMLGELRVGSKGLRIGKGRAG
jgi:hypothetical protein